MKSKYDIAKERVKKKNDFMSHLVTYIVTCGFLLAINLLTSRGYIWAIWPFLGWGIGVVFHGLDAYGVLGDKAREEELIHREMRRMERAERNVDAPGANDPDEDDRLELPEIEKEPRWNEEDLV
ncbi:MAG: 2TM domain-containing protein [Saprospiraceae bacterium]|nr:2TM domain-containing protein [Saprospiraceae bacterium]